MKMQKNKLTIGNCYKHIPSGKIYKLAWIMKRYARSTSGMMSLNVLTAGFENVLEHGDHLKQQLRYMSSADWLHLGTLQQFRGSAGRYDAFVNGEAVITLKEAKAS